MNTGFTLQECLTILVNAKNEETFNDIQSHLNKGIPIQNFFSNYLPKKYQPYFEGFVFFTSFKDAISLTYHIVNESEKTHKSQFKAMIYPVLLFLSTLFGLLAFNELCFPPLLSMLDSFQFTDPMYHQIHYIIRIVIGIILLLVLIFFIIYKYYKSHLIKLYSHFKKVPFITQIVSNDFIQFFLECSKLGISTKETLSVLQTIPNKPLVVYLSKEVEKQLLQGEGFVEAIESSQLDDMLNRFIKIAYYSSNIEGMLTSYLAVNQDRILKSIKKLTYCIQITSYTLIGIMLIFIYQVLMLPMNLLTKM